MKYIKLYQNFNQHSPIGFIDSGYGGLAIMEAVKKRFSDYDFQFLALSPNNPISNLNTSYSEDLVNKGLSYLKDSGCVTGVVACNTACILVENFPQNWVNLVKETIGYVNKLSYQNIGVLATPITINSGVYSRLNNVTEHACPLWASLVEEIRFDTLEGLAIIKSDLDSLFKKTDCDCILLACTHYILIKPIIMSLYPDIQVISQDDIMVDYFEMNGLSASQGGTCKYLTCGSSSEFDIEVAQLFNINVKSEYCEL